MLHSLNDIAKRSDGLYRDNWLPNTTLGWIHMLYDMPEVARFTNTLFWDPRDFAIRFSHRGLSRNAWSRLWGSYMVDTGTLFNNVMPLSRMLNIILVHNHIQWHPPSPWYWTWHCYHFTFLPNSKSFPKNICNGCGMPIEEYTPPNTWSYPILDLHALMLRPVLPNLVTFSDFESSILI